MVVNGVKPSRLKTDESTPGILCSPGLDRQKATPSLVTFAGSRFLIHVEEPKIIDTVIEKVNAQLDKLVLRANGYADHGTDDSNYNSSVNTPMEHSPATIDICPEKQPCAICGDKSLGFFYNCFVCEACKKFFLRASRQAPKNCRRSANCEILKGSRNCAYCRLEKCLRLGMTLKPSAGQSPSERSIELKDIACSVCDRPSSGFHFGALTCESCKGFFRRLAKQFPNADAARRRLVCASQNGRNDGVLCDVHSKRACTLCRFLKCLHVGMDLNSVRVGRWSNALKFKTKQQLEDRTHPGHLVAPVTIKTDVVSDRSPLGGCDWWPADVPEKPVVFPSVGRRLSQPAGLLNGFLGDCSFDSLFYPSVADPAMVDSPASTHATLSTPRFKVENTLPPQTPLTWEKRRLAMLEVRRVAEEALAGFDLVSRTRPHYPLPDAGDQASGLRAFVHHGTTMAFRNCIDQLIRYGRVFSTFPPLEMTCKISLIHNSIYIVPLLAYRGISYFGYDLDHVAQVSKALPHAAVSTSARLEHLRFVRERLLDYFQLTDVEVALLLAIYFFDPFCRIGQLGSYMLSAGEKSIFSTRAKLITALFFFSHRRFPDQPCRPSMLLSTLRTLVECNIENRVMVVSHMPNIRQHFNADPLFLEVFLSEQGNEPAPS